MQLYTLSAIFWRWLIGAEALTKEELVAAKQSTEAAYHRSKNLQDKRRLAREIYKLEREIGGMI